MMKDLGARAFNYGYASPVLMVATYNDDGSVNVMNLHECTRTNAGHLALCIGKPKKTHENIEKRGAFTLTLATKEMMADSADVYLRLDHRHLCFDTYRRPHIASHPWRSTYLD